MSSSTEELDASQALENDARDDGVVEEIVGFVTSPEPRSFFLFAGAGSGKTHTLKEVLVRLTGKMPEHVIGTTFAQRLQREARQLAVITYTNNAADEIERRLESNPLVAVSTIHTFCWRLIEDFNEDIRTALLTNLNEKIATKEAEKPGEFTESGKRRGPAVLERMTKKWEQSLEKLCSRLEELQATRQFSYSPDQERFGGGALSHAQVIQSASWLLENRPTLRRVLVDRHPIVFIDESQDTTKSVLHALLALEQDSELTLGLIGDHRQRIYPDGEQTLPQMVPEDWAKPSLQLNRRCPHRIVGLINAVWHSEIDARTEEPVGGTQYALSTRPPGAVRLYIGETDHEDKPAGERMCAKNMAHIASDDAWLEPEGGYKLLVLEHQLAADRGGFGELYRHLHRYDENRTKEGRIDAFSVVRNVILPLSESVTPDGAIDGWRERDVLESHAVELAPNHLAALGPDDQRAAVGRVLEGARKLRDLWDAGDPTLGDLLRSAVDSDLLALDPLLTESLSTEPPSEKITTKTPKAELLAGALMQPWSSYLSYRRYVEGRDTHGTHQGVKGSEYARVLVVIDDNAAVGYTFAYEKVFGAKAPTSSDRKNVTEGKENSIDRTLRLLYVTCSRARESLAIVLWTSSPAAVGERVQELGWFEPDEIVTVPGVPAPESPENEAPASDAPVIPRGAV